MGRGLLGGIITAGVPGVAAANAAGTAEGAAEGTIFLNGEDHVLAAGGSEAAVVSEPGANSDLVAANEGDEQRGETHSVELGNLLVCYSV